MSSNQKFKKIQLNNILIINFKKGYKDCEKVKIIKIFMKHERNMIAGQN